MVFLFHCLAYFIHIVYCSLVLSILSCQVGAPSFFLLHSVPLCKCTTVFYPLIYRWAPRLLPTFGYCKLCCYEQWGAQGLLNWCFRILRAYSQQWNPQVKSSLIFNFVRKFHTVFHSGCTSLHSHQQCTPSNSVEFPFLHILFNTCCLLICL